MTLTILLLLIYMKGLGLEFRLDFRVSAYACFSTIRKIEVSRCSMVDRGRACASSPGELGRPAVATASGAGSRPREAVARLQRASSALRWAFKCKGHTRFGGPREKRGVKRLTVFYVDYVPQ